ncbi:MAG TPA: zf-HC2 domain-containing protein [Vicinamibacteria bacterium]|nr:zf-HC2 domain-containing protein [Vicinamibacteria bacterium]
MTDEHPEIERLNEYLDQGLDPRDHRPLETNLSRCEECRRTLEELSAIVHAASELPEVAPPERIWESIAASLIERKSLSRRSSPWRSALLPALAAAAALFVGVSLSLVLRTGEAPTAADPEALAYMVTEELKAAESHYDKAIVGLEQIIAQNDGVLPQELASVLNQNLDLIENAIGESRTAIATEPQSTAAQESLLQALRSKVTLLQNTILLINEVRKGQGDNALDLIDEMRKTPVPNAPSNPI